MYGGFDWLDCFLDSTPSLELQYGIITTIRHLKDCYGYAPNIHLRHMYLRWNLGM